MPGPPVILMPADFKVTIGALEVECQVSEATVKFDTTKVTIKTLCGENELTTAERGTLTLAAYNDATLETGLYSFLWNNALATAAFELTGTDDDGNSALMAGNLQCLRPPFGSVSDDASHYSIDLPLVGIPTLTVTPAAGP